MQGVEAEVRSAYRCELQRRTRDTGLLAGLVVTIGMPACIIFDRVLAPDQAGGFLVVRLGLVAAIAGPYAVLALAGHRLRAEPLVLAIIALPALAIAWMVPRAEGAFEPYLLGLTLPLLGSAFLMSWHWRYALAIALLSIAALVPASLTAPTPLDTGQAATAGFYLGTFSAIACLGQLYRHRLAEREFVARSALEAEQQRASGLLAELERLIRQDALTGLANRRSWDELLPQAVDRARTSESPLALLLCDVDRFKDVNDRHGHAAGDSVLRRVASALADRVGEDGVAVRLGGDEFALLCPGVPLAAAAAIGIDLLGSVEAGGRSGGPAVSLSIGLAALLPSDATATELVARADEELYRAKCTRGSLWGEGRRWDDVPPVTLVG